MKRCYRSQGVLIPGCWSRAIYGDHAPCHCPKSDSKPYVDTVTERLEKRVSELEKRIAEIENARKRSSNWGEGWD